MDFLDRLFTSPGTGATQAAVNNESALATTNTGIYQNNIGPLIASLKTLANGQNPYLQQQGQATLGNQAANNQLQYKEAGAGLNSRGLFGSNIPSSMMTQLANQNITNTGQTEEAYSGMNMQSQQAALQQLMQLVSGAGSAASGQWGEVGQMGNQEQQAAGSLFSGAGQLLGGLNWGNLLTMPSGINAGSSGAGRV